MKQKIIKRPFLKKLLWIGLFCFLLGNFIVYNHAYQFTHFGDSTITRTNRPENLSLGEKLQTLFFGIQIPKPTNKHFPNREYKTIFIKSYERLEAWEIMMPESKGLVLLFHGYSTSKAGLLSYSNAFNEKGYSTLLVDFMGSGGSTGHTTTIGFKEGADVKATFEYAKKTYPNTEIILFGSSMGSAAILKSLATYKIQPDKIILECPFGSMLTTTRKRFEAMGLPTFPFAEWLLFYGGLQNGFNAFQHNPSKYARQNTIPTLLHYGAKDARVTRKEIDEIYENLAGEKHLTIFENSGHAIYLNHDSVKWHESVELFLGLED